jgi:hypothetical protein
MKQRLIGQRRVRWKKSTCGEKPQNAPFEMFQWMRRSTFGTFELLGVIDGDPSPSIPPTPADRW